MEKTKKIEIEVREFKFSELRVDPNAEWPIVGYPAVFESWSEPIWGLFREKVRAGAFSRTIRDADIRALFNHDVNYVLGRNRNGSLHLEEDERGLLMKIKPVKTQWAADLQESLKRGDIDQGSFAFRVILDEWDYSDPKMAQRTLIEVELVDVSVVTYPAYPDTSIKARAEIVAEQLRGGLEPQKELLAELVELSTRGSGPIIGIGGNFVIPPGYLDDVYGALRGSETGNTSQIGEISKNSATAGLEPAPENHPTPKTGGPVANMARRRKLLDLLEKS